MEKGEFVKNGVLSSAQNRGRTLGDTYNTYNEWGEEREDGEDVLGLRARVRNKGWRSGDCANEGEDEDEGKGWSVQGWR